MRQSNVIFGTLLFAFIVYITVRDQLPKYIDLFRAKPKVTVEVQKAGGVAGVLNKISGVNNAIAGIVSGVSNIKNSFDSSKASLKGLY